MTMPERSGTFFPFDAVILELKLYFHVPFEPVNWKPPQFVRHVQVQLLHTFSFHLYFNFSAHPIPDRS